MMRKAAALGLLSLVPLAASAQTFNLSPLADLIGAIARLVGALVPILITLALVVFFWGLVRYLWGGGSKPDVEKAKKLMLWGIIILFVMISVWGIISLMQEAFEIDENARVDAPQISYPGAARYDGSVPLGSSR